MEKQGRNTAQASEPSTASAISPKKNKLVDNFTDSNDEDDQMPLSSKFKSLKSNTQF